MQWLVSRKLDVREMRVPGNLPEETVRVREVSGVTAPVRFLCSLHDAAAARFDFGEELVDLAFRAHVVRQGEAGKSVAVRRDPDVLCQLLSRVQGEPRLSQLEEGDGRRRLDSRQLEHVLVEVS